MVYLDAFIPIDLSFFIKEGGMYLIFSNVKCCFSLFFEYFLVFDWL